MSDPLDVTGSWEGIFNYPRSMPANGFRCDLREHGGRITGETQERSDGDADQGDTILALLDGTRDGHAVHLSKCYDEPSRAHYVVTYDGTLAADGNEITGRWDIPGVWSGTFIMVRAERHGAVEERLTAEIVR